MPQVDQEGYVIFFRGNSSNGQDPSVATVPDVYPVPPGDTLNLTLSLSSVGPGTGQATYPTSVNQAIVWKTPEPPGLVLTRVNDIELILEESNSSPPTNDEEFIFQVCVVYQGTTYCTPDPTILNLGPQGPPEERRGPKSDRGPAPKG